MSIRLVSAGSFAIIFCLSSLVLADDSAASSQELFAPHLRRNHAVVIQRWLAKLKSGTKWRVATERDCLEKEGMTAERAVNANYHPYYTVGDFNGDGREDFAVVLIHELKPSKKFSFAIAVFNTSASMSFSKEPSFFTRAYDLSKSSLFFNTNLKRLLVGEYQSDNCSVFEPRNEGYILESCLE
ncbi:MAG TPA: hypothetical protein VF679_11655 [Pedobacter sp.]|jgi:hypothetical protein